LRGFIAGNPSSCRKTGVFAKPATVFCRKTAFLRIAGILCRESGFLENCLAFFTGIRIPAEKAELFQKKGLFFPGSRLF
jgi:hypothetical protein